MNFQRLDEITRRITDRLAPVHYMVKVSGPVAVRLEAYAQEQGNNAETIIAEAVRAYVGDAA